MKKALAAVALVMLMAASAQAAGVLIGGYMASDGAIDNTLAATDVAGVAPQANWNRLVDDGGYFSWISLNGSNGGYTGVQFNSEGPGSSAGASSGPVAPSNNQKLMTGARTESTAGDVYTIYGLNYLNGNTNDILFYVTGAAPARWTTQWVQGGDFPADKQWASFAASSAFEGGSVYLLSGVNVTADAFAFDLGAGASLAAFQIAPGGTLSLPTAPEPATLSLLALGGVATLIRRRNRR